MVQATPGLRLVDRPAVSRQPTGHDGSRAFAAAGLAGIDRNIAEDYGLKYVGNCCVRLLTVGNRFVKNSSTPAFDAIYKNLTCTRWMPVGPGSEKSSSTSGRPAR